jgi:hypothetical protein
MLTRIRLLSLILTPLALTAALAGANLDGSPPEVGNAEAVRLYTEANDYVSNMQEGAYSYSYLQFYWKRAESDIDRIRRVYADSPMAKAMGRGEIKVGPYSLDYFRDRVLYNLELKRLGSFDDVNCAIFLYGRDEARNDERRDEALANIIEVLARRQRWGEAMRFPVLAAHRPLLLGTIFKVAAFYGVDDIQRKLIKQTTPAERQAAGFDALTAEGMALQGKPRTELYQFVFNHPTDEVRKAAFAGVIEREVLIRRYERLHISFQNTLQTVRLVVQNAKLRDDVPSVGRKIFNGNLDAAAPQLAIYMSALGIAPESTAVEGAHLEYLQFLADSGRMDAVSTYTRDNDLRGKTKRDCQLKVIELYAEAGQVAEAEKARTDFAADFTAGADDAGLAQFRGRMVSIEVPLVAREKTFADLPISDPCIMATAIMEWSLTPNRSQRGATPWDPVVTRFAGGFTNLPKGKSVEVVDAASTLKPY